MNDAILKEYEIRKSNKEKTAFIAYIKERLMQNGYDVEKDITVETKGRGLFKSRNIVVGNPKEAEVFVTAHYDTCAVIPIPNLITPTNPVLFILYQLFLVVVIFLLAGMAAYPVMMLCDNFFAGYYTFLAVVLLIMFQLMFGYRNKHTANDNTSGTIAITKLLEVLPQEQRAKVCVVYFDNEEKGLLGSAFFHSKHKNELKDKMLINLDCVGDGENIVFMAKRKARKDKNYSILVDALNKNAKNADVRCLNLKMKPMLYPSDQANYNSGIGVCALRKSPVGMYAARIHTPFDTKCREENIVFLVNALKEFIGEIKKTE